MKKLFYGCLLTAVSISVFAQTTVALPADPVIPAMQITSPNAISALSSQTTNSVFIDQSGDSPNINATQQGSGNRMGSSSRPVRLEGIQQTVVVKQVGNNNAVDLELVNALSGDNQGITATLQQIGNSNVIDAACGYNKASDGITALTGCKAAELNWKFVGNSNTLQFRGTGDGIKSGIDASGNSNEFYFDIIGNNHSQTVKIIGDYNVMNLNQRSTGSVGSSTQIELTGTGNNISVSQTGSVDGVLNIKSTSNNGHINVTQTSGIN